jgi:hypothetical protein
MNDNKRKNSLITAWLEKRPKPNINDPIPIAVSSIKQVHSDKNSSPDLFNKNKQPLNEPTLTPFSTTIEFSNDI